jgi:hypothetical protein
MQAGMQPGPGGSYRPPPHTAPTHVVGTAGRRPSFQPPHTVPPQPFAQPIPSASMTAPVGARNILAFVVFAAPLVLATLIVAALALM